MLVVIIGVCSAPMYPLLYLTTLHHTASKNCDFGAFAKAAPGRQRSYITICVCIYLIANAGFMGKRTDLQGLLAGDMYGIGQF